MLFLIGVLLGAAAGGYGGYKYGARVKADAAAVEATAKKL